MDVPALSDIRTRMKAYTPTRIASEGNRRAAIAVVLQAPDADPRMRFIKRADRKGDPWSGQ